MNSPAFPMESDASAGTRCLLELASCGRLSRCRSPGERARPASPGLIVSASGISSATTPLYEYPDKNHILEHAKAADAIRRILI